MDSSMQMLARRGSALMYPPVRSVERGTARRVAIRDLYERWYKAKVALGRRKATLDETKYVLRACDAMGVEYLDELTPEKVDNYKIERRAAGISARTVNVAIKMIKQFGKFAVKRGVIPWHPIICLDYLPDTGKYQKRPFTQEEARALLEVSPMNYRRIWATLLTTGCRTAEIIDAKRDQLILQHGRERLRIEAWQSKTNAYREVLVGPRLMRMFRSMPFAFTDGRLFDHGDDGSLRTRRGNLLKRMRHWAAKAGIPDVAHVDDHSFRRTFATTIVTLGYDRIIGKTLMGQTVAQKRSDIFDRYVFVPEAKLREVVARVETCLLGDVPLQ